MNEDEVRQWGRLIDKVSHLTVRDFPDSALEDVQQALWVCLLEAQSRGKMLSPEEEHVESAFWYAAKGQAWKERKEHLTITPQYGYRTSDVRVLLENFFNREEWPQSITPDDAKSELGNVGMEMQSDLSRAWDKLTNPHKVLILQHFGLKYSVDSKKLSRAISRMADILNTYQSPRRHQGPGRRHVISNAQAGYVLSNLEEEDWTY